MCVGVGMHGLPRAFLLDLLSSSAPPKLLPALPGQQFGAQAPLEVPPTWASNGELSHDLLVREVAPGQVGTCTQPSVMSSSAEASTAGESQFELGT